VFLTRLVTNRFGVASADWQIPANSRLGEYQIRIQSDEDDDEHLFNELQQIKISRYDLPDFRVSAKPGRNYYLPAQGASVEIFAEYLFGKPVANAPARIVRETSRTWDYHLQKWEIEEGERYEGQTDAAGRFVARLDLEKAQQELSRENRSRFNDLSFTAYVRDPLSSRTEQRRFDVRITREAIHVYLIRNMGGPPYVSTCYADGTPASVHVKVNGIAAGITNRYGVARIPEPQGANELHIEADDGQGAYGHLEQQYDSSYGPITVRTDRSLYRPGESIHVEVTSSAPLPTAVLQVLREQRPLLSQWLDLGKKRATIVIPWREDFVHEITIAVVGGSQWEGGARTVLFPADRELKLDVRMGKTGYRPGEEADAVLEARLPNGAAAQGIFGAAIVDAAVGERARTDSESAGTGGWGWYWRDFGYNSLGGMTWRDLYRLDCSQPFPGDLDLLAETMLTNYFYFPGMEYGVDYKSDISGAFRPLLDATIRAVQDVLDRRFKKDYQYPREVSALRRELADAGIDLDTIKDPWGSPFAIKFIVEQSLEGFEFTSAGPDKASGTKDDIPAKTIVWKYFQQTHDRIAILLANLPAFPQSEQDARKALRVENIDLDQLCDPWGTAYRVQFRIQNDLAILRFISAGPDLRFETPDDFNVDEISGSYYKDTSGKLSALLAEAKAYPQNEREWNRLLRLGNVTFKTDPWGQQPYVSFARFARYTDIQKPQPGARGNPPNPTKIIPVTQWYMGIQVRSAGPDGISGTKDDLVLARFERPYEARSGKKTTLRQENYPRSRTKGAIVGTITDQSGAVIPGANIRAVCVKGPNIDFVYEAVTDEDGRYVLPLLPPGTYDIGVQVPGFRVALREGVQIIPAKATVADIVLMVGSVSETVTVMAEPVALQTAAATVAGVSGAGQSTPRLREYFPETLLWQPSVEAGPDGRAELKFKLADNITTWKLDVIGSTENGEIGTATADIKAFQPFFIDHSPPRVLTQGDEIRLPVTIRNYLDQAQDASVSVKPEKWFSLLGPAEQKIQVAAGDSANAVFPMKAIAAVSEGRQRVTATTSAGGDAVEKPVLVHPDGNETAETVNKVFSGDTTLDLAVPANAIQGSVRAELRIYPNLLAQVIDSIEGILQRPFGCAEQAISAAYPNLVFLRYLKQTSTADHPLQAKARRNLQRGVDLLLGYQAPDGGFSYWGRGEGDPSLTAYAVSFLRDAKEFVSFDEQLIKNSQDWLIRQQDKLGCWPAYDWRKQRDERQTVYQTAFIMMALSSADASNELSKALEYLRQRSERYDEPYVIAALALAAQRGNDAAVSAKALQRLRILARSDAGMTYWNLETNTPFYGWGLAGRLETSALAVQALAAGGSAEDKPLIESGMLFLLRNKDRYGVWHSTQATVRVLEAILAASQPVAAGSGGERLDVMVDDKAVTQITLPPDSELAGPIRIDLSSSLLEGKHRIALHAPGMLRQAQAQLSMSYFVPWVSRPPAGPESLRLKVSFDKLNARVGETVTCRVDVERVGFRGYGMMVAEIGLPPGADVDRRSLDSAVEGSGWTLSHYDILPDRIVAYLWPRAGGTGFSFCFRPRFAMRAKCAPSLLYDYYNPDARAVVAPATFRVE